MEAQSQQTQTETETGQKRQAKIIGEDDDEVVPWAPYISGIAPKEDDGGPIDESELTTFKDHITYAIWNREGVFSYFLPVIQIYTYI